MWKTSLSLVSETDTVTSSALKHVVSARAHYLSKAIETHVFHVRIKSVCVYVCVSWRVGVNINKEGEGCASLELTWASIQLPFRSCKQALRVSKKLGYHF